MDGIIPIGLVTLLGHVCTKIIIFHRTTHGDCPGAGTLYTMCAYYIHTHNIYIYIYREREPGDRPFRQTKPNTYVHTYVCI